MFSDKDKVFGSSVSEKMNPFTSIEFRCSEISDEVIVYNILY